MLHGNTGQASDRSYALGKIPPGDALFVLEYPGYGERPGAPSQASLDQAAQDAYRLLRREHPHQRIAVIGESIGSGPACYLCSLPAPPDRLVLMTPFDRLEAVARDHVPALLVTLLLGDDWDNLRALRDYAGPIAIFAGTADTVIPPDHGRALAASKPQATLTMFPGGHNDWAASPGVRVED